jgi:hypothetical protein
MVLLKKCPVVWQDFTVVITSVDNKDALACLPQPNSNDGQYNGCM